MTDEHLLVDMAWFALSALASVALVCALLGALVVVRQLARAWRRRRLRRSPWWTALRHSVWRTA